MLKKIGIDWFIISIVCVIGIAFFFPSIGVDNDTFKVSQIAGYGIAFIFFFYGVKLTPKQFAHGLQNWSMHVLIQCTTFLVFPLLVFFIKPFVVNENLWLSLFFLASLPSTVSSSIVMISIAKGNIPAGIFNASISSLLGIIITPALMGIFMIQQNLSFDSAEIYGKLLFQILLPIILGMSCRPFLGKFAHAFSKHLKVCDQLVILFIIFTSFCSSFATNAFEFFSASSFVLLFIGIIGLFVIVFYILQKLCKQMRYNYEDTITVLFCGSKKSLLHGVVISKVLFIGTAVSGVILLPIMIYHATQLIFVSMYATKQVRKIRINN